MRDQPNRILEFLTAPAKPDGDACRSNRRRRSTARVELAWREGNAWRTIPARLRDIGRGGAGLFTRTVPPLTRNARVRFVEGDGSPWFEAEILGVEPETPTKNRVRLRFEVPCPSILLRMAVLGNVEPEEEAPAAGHGWFPCQATANE